VAGSREAVYEDHRATEVAAAHALNGAATATDVTLTGVATTTDVVEITGTTEMVYIYMYM
jgi:hypothetical protein